MSSSAFTDILYYDFSESCYTRVGGCASVSHRVVTQEAQVFAGGSHGTTQKRGACLQEKEKQLEEKIDNLIDLRVEDPTVFTPESFKRKLNGLEEELEDVQKKHRDHAAAAKTWRDSIISSLEFLEGVRMRFATGERDDRLEILHRLW